MRYLLLVFIQAFTAYLKGQEIPKKAEVIFVHNTYSAEDNFINVKKYLVSNGIEVANQDRDVFQIKTGNIEGKRGLILNYLINCSDNSLAVRGNYVFMGENSKISNIGMKGSAAAITFTSMLDFVRSMNLGDIQFK